jgi:4-amino-4-deoxy-L-arabinose transferase-like glycosyltransferase
MEKSFNLASRLRNSAFTSILLGVILAGCLLAVSFSIKSYGASYDETSDYDYAGANLRVYVNLIYGKPYDELIHLYDLRYKGPAYWFVGEISAYSLKRMIPGLDIYDGWHLVNFATFLVGAWCIYCLARRFVSVWAALLAALIYLSQPLLWGHGVMNPKDTPFMVFFLATITLGVKVVDDFDRPSGLGRGMEVFFQGRRKYILGLFAVLVTLALADRIFGHFISQPVITSVLSQAYDPNATGWLHSAFARLAANAATIPVTTYIDKAVQMVNVIEFAFSTLVLGAAALTWFIRTAPRNRWIVLAGIVGGMTISIRVLGPAAVGLVALYVLLKLGKRAIAAVGGYGAVSLAAAYAFWPFLWSNPIGRFIDSLGAMSEFPWNGPVRFEGTDYTTSTLPWYYLPKLISLQLTLPLLILAIAGVGLAVLSIARKKLDWRLALIPLAWFWLPLMIVMVKRPNMYDNFRQFLFILPPLFLFAALAFEFLLDKLRLRWVQMLACLAILLPGIAAGFWLHPYEYIYYNALVGWTGQVNRDYEGDYWFTAMCETGRYLNAFAPEGGSVALTDPTARTLFERCTDKKYVIYVERAEKSQINPQYSVIYTRYDDDKDYFRKMKIIDTIQRGKTEFAVVKQAP